MIPYIDASEVLKQLPNGCERARYQTDTVHTVTISPQMTGFGTRYFLVCPACGRRVQRLYLCCGRLICRTCGKVPLYRGIQNSTRGGYFEIQYRMDRFAAKHGIKFDYPFDYMQFLLDKRIRRENFRRKVRILQSLENMRLQCILFRSRYERETIRSVLAGNHPLVLNERITLKDLRDNLYRW